MAKKTFSGGLVYSTNKALMQNNADEDAPVIAPAEQQLIITLDKKHRAGKTVTLITGYSGSGIDALCKQLKQHCGTGGAAKDGEIVIQGDNREKVFAYLQKQGYVKTLKR